MTIREKLGENRYQKFLENCILNEGNPYRLNKAIEKEQINMAFLGGSVTMGCLKNGILSENYSTLLINRIKQAWKGKSFTSLNLGTAGVSSSYGLIQTEKHLSGYKPDVEFVEFSVNDGSSLKDISVFESLICKLMQQEQEPAVIILTLMAECYNPAGEWMLEIGRHYKLPVIGIKKEFTGCIESNQLTWNDYAEDEVHPHNNGHRLICDCLYHGIKHLTECIPQEKEEINRNYFSSAPMTNLKLLDLQNSNGTFRLEQGKDYGNYLENDIQAVDHYVQFDCDCIGLVIVYEQSNSRTYGSLQVLIDGNDSGALRGYSIFGWNNPVTQILYFEEEKALHSIKFRMTESDENKIFRILDIGWF